jgi:hypothetical protein
MKEKSKETSPIKLKGLWKDGDASYHFHIPIEYEVVEKGSDSPTSKYSTAFVKIKPISIYQHKQTSYLDVPDIRKYEFWMRRRYIRRGPKSWAIKTNRWIHKEYFVRALYRAVDGKEDFEQHFWWPY